MIYLAMVAKFHFELNEKKPAYNIQLNTHTHNKWLNNGIKLFIFDVKYNFFLVIWKRYETLINFFYFFFLQKKATGFYSLNTLE